MSDSVGACGSLFLRGNRNGDRKSLSHQGLLSFSPVMVNGVECRRAVNPAMGRSLAGRQGRWPGNKSRMRRESHVRFREGLGVKFPRATRLVICCRGTAAEAMAVMRSMMSKLRLTVNETKTRLCRLPEESVDFLGYTIGLSHSPQTGRSYLG